MVKISHLDDALSEFFEMDANPVLRRVITVAKRKLKAKNKDYR